MKKTKVKIPAKINLTLDIIGRENGYHNIRSLVSSVDIYDYIKVKKRNDNKVNLHLSGKDCECEKKDNNAYKACRLFMDRYHTKGADIYITKNIPIGAGLGGSSADIAGVLKCMKRIYNQKADIFSLANELGSDAGYMINGGYAVISGRGDEVVPVKSKVSIPVLIICDTEKITAKQGYSGFDDLNRTYPSVTFDAVAKLINLKEKFFELLKNDLQPYAELILPSLQGRVKDLKSNGALCTVMTGSGSAIYGLFGSVKERNKAYKALKVKYGDLLYKCKTE